MPSLETRVVRWLRRLSALDSLALAMLWFGLVATFVGCVAAKPACTVIDLAHSACGAFVAVKLEDGSVVSVPVGDLRAAAQRTQAASAGSSAPGASGAAGTAGASGSKGTGGSP